jgi:hypothetical protein
MLQITHLDYDFFPFLTADYEVHSGSCICHLAEELPEIYEPYGGMPDTYETSNTLIHQLWWSQDQIDYNELERQLGIEVVTVSSILQKPGCIIPYHRDTFFQINKRFPNHSGLKVRANIYLEDYKLGHLIQYTNQGKLYTSVDWKAGDGFIWDSEIAHLGANAGLENKYTLQISGFIKNLSIFT